MNKSKLFVKKAISALVATLVLGSAIPTTFADSITVKTSTSKTSINFIVGKVYNGFKLKQEKYVKEMESDVMIFEHVKSGAELVYVKNDDDNKVFSIDFRTPVNDNTGVNHIIEHSVLCGSKKYPVKDPFLQMSKQSLNTFLNAYTGTDVTAYPVASRNQKDFKNLMSVYLDAVFYPNIYKEANIFKQEGWHYELDSKDSELKYNGVVYNEMKGMLSSPSNLLSDKINESLFPDTTYKWESGGTVDGIPTLTREKFLNTHKKYYQPSNSLIYLYGNLDIDDTLSYIDKNYLSKFNKTKVDSELKAQTPFEKEVVKTSEYAIAKGTSTDNKTFLSSNYVVDKVTNKETSLAFAVLTDILTGSSSSPIKKALTENKLGENNYATFSIGNGLQPVFSIISENANEKDKQKFEDVINKTLKDVVKNGIDKKALKALINTYEISSRTKNSDAQRGLNYNSYVTMSWLYNADPTMYFELDPMIDIMKKGLDSNYFENLIQKYLIDNNHKSIVVLKPKAGLEEENEAKLKAKLAKYKKSLSTKQVDQLVKDTAELKKWQSSPDSSEAMATIPTLTKADLNPKAEEIPTKEYTEQGIKVLNHPIYTNNIAYVNLYFDATKVPQDKILYLNLLTKLLGKTSTQKYGYSDIDNEINSNLGGISFGLNVLNKYKDDKVYYPKMEVSFYTVTDKLAGAYGILGEIINNSKFDEKERIKELIKEIKSDIQNSIAGDAAMSIAGKRCLSYYSEAGKYSEQGNLEFYNFICDLDKNFDSKADEIAKNLKETAQTVFNKDNLLVSVTDNEEAYKSFQDSFSTLANQLADNKLPAQTYKFDYSNKNEGLMTQSKVQYVVKGYDYKTEGYEYNGSMKVLETIINSEYMWMKLRVLGGAYGGFIQIADNGNLACASYRDPNLKETLSVFDELPNYLRNFSADDATMTNYIIGTIGSLDYPLSPSQKGSVADEYYIAGISQSDIQKMRDEVLNTKAEDIVKYTDMIDKVMKENNYCVVGSESKIKENNDIFKSVINIQDK